ncbi:hypothetical protein [Halodesulfovibrio aestuarii]|uniref:Uncharacterized protein n=1 Tax=Halodesulfovibrio aestuarii TaxID=126333 RepID=A0A8G2C961_9BACT|nr:hypothetical protein [Halodesulfovibrio aestuarii]SHJ04232.1 hypothetical protein SAMN05660830_01456 [Halodesulfovibrio aestuarii]
MKASEFAKRHHIKLTEVIRMSGFGRSTLFNWWNDPKTRTRTIVIILGCAEAKKYTRVFHDDETKKIIDSVMSVER